MNLKLNDVNFILRLQMRSLCSFPTVRSRHTINDLSQHGHRNPVRPCIHNFHANWQIAQPIFPLYRVFALYQRSRVVGTLLVVYLLAEIAVALWIYCTPGSHREWMANNIFSRSEVMNFFLHSSSRPSWGCRFGCVRQYVDMLVTVLSGSWLTAATVCIDIISESLCVPHHLFDASDSEN